MTTQHSQDQEATISPPAITRWDPVNDDPSNADLIEELAAHIQANDPNNGLDPQFADNLTSDKPENHLRVMFNNVRGLPVHKGDLKDRHFIDQMRHFKTDVLLGAEHN